MKQYVLASLAVFTMSLGGALAAPSAKSIPRKKSDANVQPLTYANVIAHFKAAELKAIEVQKRCTIFFEGEWKSAGIYDYAVIVVENSDQDIQVTFYLTDAHEMNWITEFLDAPFFARGETDKLFDLMNSDRDRRDEQVGRFRVDFHHWKPRHAEIIVFSFTPVRGR